MDLTKQFNTWLFDVVLGKLAVSPEPLSEYNVVDSSKTYYVLPLHRDERRSIEIDWSIMISSLKAELSYGSKIRLWGGLPNLEGGEMESDLEALNLDKIVMRNGTFSIMDLDDAMITSPHSGMPCFVISILKHINGSSCFQSAENPGSLTYTDYYASK